MTSRKRSDISQALSEEVGLELSPFTIALKHVHELSPVGRGFCLTYTQEGVIYYDRIPTIRELNSRRVRPTRFEIHPIVQHRIRERHYRYWYFYDHKYLYPMHALKPKVFFDEFLFHPHHNPHYQTEVVCEIETPHRRRKPLQTALAGAWWSPGRWACDSLSPYAEASS